MNVYNYFSSRVLRLAVLPLPCSGLFEPLTSANGLLVSSIELIHGDIFGELWIIVGVGAGLITYSTLASYKLQKHYVILSC
jgi:hypothetical protein